MLHCTTTRRRWLIGGTVLATTFCSRLGTAAAQGSGAGKVALIPNPSGNLHRVRLEMEIEGNINVPGNPLVSKQRAAQIPVRSRSVLDWEERVLGVDADDSPQAAEQFYFEAHSSSKVGKKERRIELGDQSRAVQVQRDSGRWVVYSPDTYLDSQEMDLLKVPANSLAMDSLLPAVPVAVGDRFEPPGPALARLLNLNAVHATTVSGKVVEIDEDAAKIHYEGKVDGSVSGVPTVIEVVAKLVFDRRAAACTWLAIAIRETREIGKSEPGFDVAGTIRLVRKPLDKPLRLAADAPSPPAGIPAERLYSELVSRPVGFAVLMDRRWKIMTDVAGASMMRMVDDDRGIAQCDLRPLGKLAAGSQLTLEAFTHESRTSLGERFVEVLEGREELNAAGLRVLRVAIQGEAQGVPVQWIFLHFSDDSGRRLLATVTVGNEHLDDFAGADEQLSGSLRFLPLDDATLGVANRSKGSGVK